MEIYVVLLEKVALLHKGCFDGTPVQKKVKNIDGTWLTLGHFDAMYTYKIDSKKENIFQTIYENNKRIRGCCDGSYYYHPLYLIPEKGAKEQKADRKFWEREAYFFAAVRIHFAESIGVAAYGEIKNRLQQAAPREICSFRAYRTIELSDMILAVKSKQFSDLLKFVLSMRQYLSVGKTYSYCGIGYEAMQDEGWYPDWQDEIDIFSVRFSVEDFSKLEEQLKVMKEKLEKEETYSIVGVDDIAINWEKLKVRKIVDLYRYWFLSGAGMEEKVFSEMTTRVGISLENLKLPHGVVSERSNNKECSSAKLQNACRKLININHDIQNIGNRSESERYSWLRPLSELVNVLMRMSRTAVLDEFVYLMLPAVQAFLENLKERLCELRETDIQECQNFVENWSDLIEYVMRIEGQLTHHPEMRPALYDIPVAMLEYNLAFLQQIGEVLQQEDEPKSNICFLLVPHICDRIVTKELFPPKLDRLPGLGLIVVPLDSLYAPCEVLMALCHEAAHFVGEKHRKRGYRTKCYAHAVATLMAAEVFDSHHPAVIATIEKDLGKVLQKLKEHDNKCVMLHMKEKINEWLDDLLQVDKKYSNFFRNVLRASKGNEASLHLKLKGRLYENRKNDFKNLLEDLSVLFREIYADICMLYLLPLDAKVYVKSFLPELTPNKNDAKRVQYEHFAIRICVSLMATKHQIPNSSGEDGELLYRALTRIHRYVKNKSWNEGSLGLVSSTDSLLEYARECYLSLETSLQGSKQAKKIRKMFNNAASLDLNYDQFLNDINGYRAKILSR